MSELLTHIQQLRAGDPQPLLAFVPYTRWLGIELEVSEVGVLGVLRYRPHLVGNPRLPALHGGTVAALLESIAVFQVLWQADQVVLPKTINTTVQYLRPARTSDTFARAVVTKLGRRVAAVRMEAWQQDEQRPVASAIANLLIS